MKEQCISFLEKAVTAYQTICEVKRQLTEAGYEELCETQSWKLKAGGRYFVVRGDSSLIAFQIPGEQEAKGYRIVCAHSDSPCFKIKENPVMQTEQHYLKLNVEKYGGMIAESWFDRPLSIAGRIVVCDHTGREGKLVSIPVDLKKPVLIIPSLAIHMKRDNKEQPINPQLHLLPLAGMCADGEKTDFLQYIADAANKERVAESAMGNAEDTNQRIQKEDILGMDLYVYACDKPVIMGFSEEFLGAPRLDDLLCVYCGLSAMLQTKAEDMIPVLGIFDNEEVGSKTLQGADSDFLRSILSRISDASGDLTTLAERHERMRAESFLLSADNAHALHPNYTDKADPTNKPVLNGGIVLKYHAGQKYTTSGYSGAWVKRLCLQEEIPFQTYHNRSDIAGGSTLGNIATSHISMPAADVGLPQLAMHSAFETAGVRDIADMCRLMEAFYRA